MRNFSFSIEILELKFAEVGFSNFTSKIIKYSLKLIKTTIFKIKTTKKLLNHFCSHLLFAQA